MITKTINYNNFRGEKVTRNLMFNITRTELIEMETSIEGGFSNLLTSITKNENPTEIIPVVKKLILTAYGELSNDGETFMKSDAIRAKFENSAAYDALFTEFVSNGDSFAQFVNGIIPALTLEEKKQLENKTNELTSFGGDNK